VVIELGFNGSWLGFNGDFVEFIEFNGGFCGISWDFNGMQFQIQIYLCLNRKKCDNFGGFAKRHIGLWSLMLLNHQNICC
jgi:hypothetical protein